jgi:hypothetical protein
VNSMYSGAEHDSVQSRHVSQSPLIEQSAAVMAALLDKSSHILDKKFGQHYAARHSQLVGELVKVGAQEYIEAARSIEWASHIANLCKAIDGRRG